MQKLVVPPSGGLMISQYPPEGGTTNFFMISQYPPEGGTTNFFEIRVYCISLLISRRMFTISHLPLNFAI